MKVWPEICALALALVPVAAAAQQYPEPSLDNPRIQTIRFVPNQEHVLEVLMDSSLTLKLEEGERISTVLPDADGAFATAIEDEGNSLNITPRGAGSSTGMVIATDRRFYRLMVTTGTSLLAATAITFRYDAPADLAGAPPGPPAAASSYRLRGDRGLFPATIRDDGIRTWLTFAPDQALPAVFAIGAAGEEETTNGYMRDGTFVLDRVYPQLVFRIDRLKATAERETVRSRRR